MLADERCCLYAEPLFVRHAARPVNLVMVEPTYGWLAELPAAYPRRRVRLTTIGAGRRLDGPTFFKSAGEKFFAAGVFDGGGG